MIPAPPGGILGVGVSDGTNAYSVGYGVLHNPGTPSSRRRINSSAIQIIDGSGTLSLEGTVAFTSTQVTFTWTTRTSAAQTVINYILFGGSALEAMVRQWSVGTTNGTDRSVTTFTGMKPNLCFHIWGGPTAATLGTAGTPPLSASA